MRTGIGSLFSLSSPVTWLYQVRLSNFQVNFNRMASVLLANINCLRASLLRTTVDFQLLVNRRQGMCRQTGPCNTPSAEGSHKKPTSAMHVRIIRHSLPLCSRCSSAKKQKQVLHEPHKPGNAKAISFCSNERKPSLGESSYPTSSRIANNPTILIRYSPSWLGIKSHKAFPQSF